MRNHIRTADGCQALLVFYDGGQVGREIALPAVGGNVEDCHCLVALLIDVLADCKVEPLLVEIVVHGSIENPLAEREP